MSGPQGFRRRDGNASDAIAAILHPCMGHRCVHSFSARAATILLVVW